MNSDQIRASQIISTYGPGALVDFPESSIIVSGLDQWKYATANIPTIDEPRLLQKLERILNRTQLSLRKPPNSQNEDHGARPQITGWRFPVWFTVQKPQKSPQGYLRSRLVHLNSLDKNRFRDEEGVKQSVVPIRFVRACKKGHIDDIEWREFIHGGPTQCIRNLWIEERGTSGDLGDIWAVCDCGARNSMAFASKMDNKGQGSLALGSCRGARPWLGAGTREQCGVPSRLLIRSASNAYFPQTMSVISIPSSHTPIDDAVRALWDNFLSDVNSVEDLHKYLKKPMVAAALQGMKVDDVWAAIQRKRQGVDESDRPVKEVEFEALSSSAPELGTETPDGIFFARALPEKNWASKFMNGIERIVLVHRLREVIALVGFTRFEAAGTDIQGELSMDVERAPLAIDAAWLPAIENKGEGIFIQFNASAINEWENKEGVKERALKFTEGFMDWKEDHPHGEAFFPGMAYCLLHSLSHLLLMSISLECGYPASSLKERIYASAGNYGILLYTGSSDSEGTLGGLVMAGKDINRHFWRALEMGTLCSNDPICAIHAPNMKDNQSLLGSACHGCLLISETSCEKWNEFLDRALVIPTVENLGCNFFDLSL